MCMNLGFVRHPLGNKKIDQWTLIALAIDAQLKVTVNDWSLSHIRVNTCPSAHTPFEEWIKELNDRGVLVSGEKFYTKRTSLFDAMPACWTKLSVEQRHDVLSICKNAYDLAELCGDRPEWTKEAVCALARYVKLEDVHKLRACYLVAQKDPSIIVHDDGTRVEEAAASASTAASDSTAASASMQEPSVAAAAEEAQAKANGSTARDFFHWQPKNLMQPYMLNKKDPEAQSKLFHHMTNYTAQMMWNANSKQRLEPSAYLDANISEDQRELLCPSYKNMLQGFIMYDVKGKGAQNKLAKRRLDMISGNVSSYSRCLNDPKRLKQIKEVNELAATVAEVTADIAQEKKNQKTKKDQKVKASKEKKAADKAYEEAKRAEELPQLRLLMEDFETGRKRLTDSDSKLFSKAYLIKILKYYYNARPKGAQSMNKAQIFNELVKCFEAKEAEKEAVTPI